MANYTVKSASVGGLNNKIYSYGDVVSDLNFPKGNAAKLVEQGFLDAIVEEEVEETKTEKTKTKK